MNFIFISINVSTSLFAIFYWNSFSSIFLWNSPCSLTWTLSLIPIHGLCLTAIANISSLTLYNNWQILAKRIIFYRYDIRSDWNWMQLQLLATKINFNKQRHRRRWRQRQMRRRRLTQNQRRRWINIILGLIECNCQCHQVVLVEQLADIGKEN